MSMVSTPVTGKLYTNAEDHITDPLITDDVRTVFQWILFAVLGQLLDVFGAATNIVNIICFAKQGFKDAVNVSLIGNKRLFIKHTM